MPETLPIAFVVPLQGPTGIYGPSCLACGELAVEQLNSASGILGKRVELVVVDGGREPDVVAAEVGALVDSGRVHAVAGWHISAVRQAITRRIGGKVVYAYAAMHEGRDDTPGVFMLGERPINQLLPAAHWMREQLGVGRWAVVGNDYVFPRVTGATARVALQDGPSSVVSETYVPLGTTNFSRVLTELDSAGADGVIMLLMGQDAVHFNRQFSRFGLSDRLARLSPAVEENTLLGGGAGAHENLYAAAAYFDGLDTVESSALSEAYYARYGRWAPALNAVGESCYEAILFLARLGKTCGSVAVADVGAMSSGTFYDGPRGLVRLDGNLLNQDVYLAAARGLEFEVQEQIARAV
ncbi:substrate-binding domain-containing protein [Nocardioides sp. Kera G14]|uniref:substrate-binding domain-containing protein n=1 Tax=Nocardioides sp. Kera G14 TaxID=2884264 RepID=UPI001D0F8E5C|nr:substrate-binding domain-containing protein [Nocardioides sp. Kera G14]UDY25207.1 substrate-binding domain-containing protein [Nocardioides sp. Kera G14]